MCSMINTWCAFYSVIYGITQALITVIFLELTLIPPLQKSPLFIRCFIYLGFQKFPLYVFRNSALSQAQTYLHLCCPSLLAAEPKAGVISNHWCLSCLSTPSSSPAQGNSSAANPTVGKLQKLSVQTPPKCTCPCR